MLLGIVCVVAVTLIVAVALWPPVPASKPKRAARVEREPLRVVVRGPVELL